MYNILNGDGSDSRQSLVATFLNALAFPPIYSILPTAILKCPIQGPCLIGHTVLPNGDERIRLSKDGVIIGVGEP